MVLPETCIGHDFWHPEGGDIKFWERELRLRVARLGPWLGRQKLSSVAGDLKGPSGGSRVADHYKSGNWFSEGVC